MCKSFFIYLTHKIDDQLEMKTYSDDKKEIEKKLWVKSKFFLCRKEFAESDTVRHHTLAPSTKVQTCAERESSELPSAVPSYFDFFKKN
jgi:hypothetical protein